MQKYRSFMGSTAVMLLALVFLVSTPTFALTEVPEDGTPKTSSEESVKPTPTRENKVQASTTTTKTDATTAESRQQKLSNTSATDAKQSAKTAAKAKSSEKKKKVCEAHTKGLKTKFNRMNTNSERTHTRITEILNKAIAYQQESKLEVANFAVLVAEAERAGVESSAALTLLGQVTPSIDCNNHGAVASSVAAFKTEAQKTRDSLKAYKQAVKNILQSLREAKKATANTEAKPEVEGVKPAEGSN